MSQARKILKDNDISKDDERFKKITDKTKKDGYTGFITKLVFEFAMNLEGALSMYDQLKQHKIDIGTPKIKSILDDKGMSNSHKIQHIINLIRNAKDDASPGDYELLFNSNGFNVYWVKDYKGIMCTGSPAWCLKTKSFWNQYTKQNRGTQFVLIDNRLVGDNDEFEVTVPNTWDGVSYHNPGWESTRYGVTIYPSGRMDIFDDGNTQSMVSFDEDGELKVTRGSLPIFTQRVLKELHKYYMKEIQPNVPEAVDIPQPTVDGDRLQDIPQFDGDESYDAFVDFMEEIKYAVDGVHTSFNYTVEFDSFNTDEVYENFINAIKEGMGLDSKEEIFRFMGQYKNRILSDGRFTEVSGILDIFLNEFVCFNFEDNRTEDEEGSIALDEFPTITKHTIPLGGYYIDEQGIGEVVMKYQYGFQYEKYGKAVILQSYETLTDFYAAMAHDFYEVVTEGELLWMDILGSFELDQINNEDKEKLFTTTPFNDGYKVTIHFDELFKYKNSGDNRNKTILKYDMLDGLNPFFKNTFIKDGDIIVPIYSNPVRESDE
jgi:hypothetical protein